MARAITLDRGGVRLAGLDFGGAGPVVLLLHGLAGYAGEWAQTAAWLAERHRVVALDARGHGRSERRPGDVSRGAHVADALFAIDALALAPVVLVGQSLGAQAALLVAAERPDAVRGLVVAEASPDSGGGDAHLEVEQSLRRWPVPFPSREAAVDFFGGTPLKAQTWAGGLEQRDDGWWPAFDLDVIVRTVREADSRTYWGEWESISCPALVVRAENGTLPGEHAREVVRRARQAELAEIPGAGHDLHLDAPDGWRRVLEGFLDRLG